MGIGDRIRTTRKAAGLSQEDLARRAGMSLKGMGDIERGAIADPHYLSLKKIADGLGIPVGELLEEPVPLGESAEVGAEITFPLDIDQIRREVAGEDWAETWTTLAIKKRVEEEIEHRYSDPERIELRRQFNELIERLSPEKETRFEEYAKAVEGFGYVSRVLERTASPQHA